MKAPIRKCLTGCACLWAVGQIGNMAFQDALISEQNTCAMVRDGIWPAEQAENYNCAEPVQVAGVDDAGI